MSETVQYHPSSFRQSSGKLINTAHVKRYLLDVAEQTRPTANFRRVSAEALTEAESVLRQWARGYVHTAPSRRTL